MYSLLGTYGKTIVDGVVGVTEGEQARITLISTSNVALTPPRVVAVTEKVAPVVGGTFEFWIVIPVDDAKVANASAFSRVYASSLTRH